ncbi:MAG TPA: tetratricopeptide repeat protein [Solirubrobacteraceae bacterium]|nr:tetratricopeptide repeat protein [Solirubrobacteraceae bacterium]
MIAELELAGLPVRRGPRIASQGRDPAVRLCAPSGTEVPESSPSALPTALLTDPPARRDHRRGALLAAIGSIACAVVVLAAIGLLSTRGHGSPARAPLTPGSAAQATAKPRAAARRSAAARPPRASVLPANRHRRRVTPTAPVVPRSSAALQLTGHELLANGRFAQATTLLRRAMRATGKDVASCITPAGEGCLVYAYALYDLGRALLLEGRPAAAISVLRERLQIANQQPVVATELALARSAEARK